MSDLKEFLTQHKFIKHYGVALFEEELITEVEDLLKCTVKELRDDVGMKERHAEKLLQLAKKHCESSAQPQAIPAPVATKPPPVSVENASPAAAASPASAAGVSLAAERSPTLGDVLDTRRRYREKLGDIIGENDDVELPSFMAEGGELRADLTEDVTATGDRHLQRTWKAFIDDCSRFFSELQREGAGSAAVAPLVAGVSMLALQEELQRIEQLIVGEASTALTLSDSQRGRELLDGITRVIDHGEGEAVLSEQQHAELLRALEAEPPRGFQKEEHFVQLLMPVLRVRLSAPMLFITSERCAWLRTGALPAYWRKPDAWVGPGCFYEKHLDGRGESIAPVGKPANWRLRDSVTLLAEAKLQESLHETLGQLKHDFDHLVEGESGQITRTGLLLLPHVFCVAKFMRNVLVSLAECGWSQAGGAELLREALNCRSLWSSAIARFEAQLGVKCLADGSAFLGMGAFGRVVACMRGDEQLALKMVSCSDVEQEARCRLEYDRLRQARGANVIHVLDDSWRSVRQHAESRWAVGYLMQRGESLEVERVRVQPNVRRQMLEAMELLHASGWYHGDARVANLVIVARRRLVWVDFLDAHWVDPAGSDFAEVFNFWRHKDMEKLIRSAYARVQGIQSPDMKLPRSVMEVIALYADGSVDARAVWKSCERALATTK